MKKIIIIVSLIILLIPSTAKSKIIEVCRQPTVIDTTKIVFMSKSIKSHTLTLNFSSELLAVRCASKKARNREYERIKQLMKSK